MNYIDKCRLYKNFVNSSSFGNGQDFLFRSPVKQPGVVKKKKSMFLIVVLVLLLLPCSAIYIGLFSRLIPLLRLILFFYTYSGLVIKLQRILLLCHFSKLTL